MVNLARFGQKLRTPAPFQIKHQFLIWWLREQRDKESAQDAKRRQNQAAALYAPIPHANI